MHSIELEEQSSYATCIMFGLQFALQSRVLTHTDTAAVYSVMHTISGALYAIKVMNKSFIKGTDMEARVMQERRIMSLISSHNPYVVQLYFAFRSKDFLFLVLEYVNGGDCHRCVRTLMFTHSASFAFVVNMSDHNDELALLQAVAVISA
jgi:serum/glucocorticoid-regulated kinase 2